MALVKCPECGKDISDTCENCIYCGYPIRKGEKINKKIVFGVGGLAIVVAFAVIVVSIINKTPPHAIKNTKLMKLMEYTSSSEIKNDLGDDYEHKVWDTSDSTSDVYEDIVIDGKEYEKVEISYQSNGDFERIYLNSDSVWTEEEYKILVKDFIEQYGGEYDYKEDEYKGNAIYDYSWYMSFYRRVSLSVHQSSDDKKMYWVRINSFHN